MAFVKERFGNKAIVGAEVGVETGLHALDILQNMPNIRLLYLVDPYLEYPPYKNDTKKKLFPFNNRIWWIYKEFEVCTIQDIPDPLDFIYIDGNHEYEYVKQDIVLATQLVKKGGVIGGHDIGSLGIDRAIKEYCERKNITWYVGKNEAVLSEVNGKPLQQGWDWWFINV